MLTGVHSDPSRRTADVTRTVDEETLWDLAGDLDLSTVFDNAARHRLGSAAVRPAHPRPDVAAYPDPATGGTAHLPARALTTLYEAGRAAAATRRSLDTGALTVDVVGTVPQIWWHVAVLCRSVWMITDIAVTADVTTMPPRLADQLDLAGVDLGAVAAPAVASGASLVVATGPANVRADRLAPGALLIEAVPNAFPPALHRLAGTTPPTRSRGGGFTMVQAPAPDAALETAFVAELLTATAPRAGR